MVPSAQSPPSADQVLASAVRFLIDSGEDDAASVLLSCDLKIHYTGTGWVQDVGELHDAAIELRAPAPAYQALRISDGDEWPADVPAGTPVYRPMVEAALAAVLPSWAHTPTLTLRAQLIEIDEDWRSELLEIARGRGVSNQGVAIDRPLAVWKNLRFRSKSEMRIAQALDRASVLFWPNCMARLGVSAEHRVNRESDFLVCHRGRFGILEVDGEPFHPPSRAAQDHARDRLFGEHGLRVVHRFAATECYETPDQVVTEFLRQLAQP